MAFPVGYSGREAPDNFDVVKVAVAKGATILERHVGIETETIKLNKYSMNPEQVDEWVRSALAAKEIGGAKDLDKPIGEKRDCGITLPVKRGVYAVRDIEKGETIRREDVFFAMPCADGQVSSGEFGQYRSVWKASKDYPREAPNLRTFPAGNYSRHTKHYPRCEGHAL